MLAFNTLLRNLLGRRGCVARSLTRSDPYEAPTLRADRAVGYLTPHNAAAGGNAQGSFPAGQCLSCSHREGSRVRAFRPACHRPPCPPTWRRPPPALRCARHTPITASAPCLRGRRNEDLVFSTRSLVALLLGMTRA